MRAISLLSILALVAGLAAAETRPATISKDGKPALTLLIPADWQHGPGGGGRTNMLPASGHPHVQVWSVAGTLAEAVAGIAPLLKDEVADFKIASTEDLIVAGAPTKRLIGTGTEADDGDPSNAEVVVFTLAGSTWLLLSHGEGDGTGKARPTLSTVLASATVAK